jgi:hypothetical protein
MLNCDFNNRRILLISVLALVLIVGAGIYSLPVSAQTWQQPQNTPPNCISGQPGCDPPINTSATGQSKDAGLILNWLPFPQGSQYGLLVRNGNVGIGDLDPSALLVVGPDGNFGAVDGANDLYVADSIEVDGSLCLNNICASDWSGVVGAGGGAYWDADGNDIYNNSAGFVGINVGDDTTWTVPRFVLDVRDNGNLDPIVNVDVSGLVDHKTGFRIGIGGTEQWFIGMPDPSPAGDTKLRIQNSGADLMVIDDITGQVGIGEDVPEGLLQVGSSNAGGTPGKIVFGDNANYGNEAEIYSDGTSGADLILKSYSADGDIFIRGSDALSGQTEAGIYFQDDDATLNAMYIGTGGTNAGNVGIGSTNPGGNKLYVLRAENYDVSESTFQNTLFDLNVSGTVDQGTNMSSRGVYIDVDSSAQGTIATGNRHYLYGLYNRVDVNNPGKPYYAMGTYNLVTNRSDNSPGYIYGAYNYARNMQNLGSMTAMYGANNLAYNQGDMTITNLWGAYDIASNYGNGLASDARGTYGYAFNYQGGTITNAQGGYFHVRNNNALGTITNAFGARGYIQESAGTIGTGYGFYSDCDGADTCYGLYVSAGDAGVLADQDYGIYVTGEDSNYFSGDVGVGGDLTVTGSDVAEVFSTPYDLTEGTVVVMDENSREHRSSRPCEQEYDSGVVGVVSNNPAIIMGEVDSQFSEIIAVTGIVKVKVVNYNGNIKKGDLLTTSSVKGHAMKASDPKIGTIIGKALEDFNGYQGEIMALINLQ